MTLTGGYTQLSRKVFNMSKSDYDSDYEKLPLRHYHLSFLPIKVVPILIHSINTPPPNHTLNTHASNFRIHIP